MNIIYANESQGTQWMLECFVKGVLVVTANIKPLLEQNYQKHKLVVQYKRRTKIPAPWV